MASGSKSVEKSGPKAKFPAMSGPPDIAHCSPSQLMRGGNRHMSWWDCSGCQERISDQRVNDEAVYYSVPPCALSPNWDPLQALQPKEKKALKEAKRAPTPPLDKKAAAAFREVKQEPRFTTEQEQVLAAARQILREAQQPTSAASSGVHRAPKAAPRAPKRNAENPKPEFDSMSQDAEDQDYAHVMTNQEILAQLAAMDQMAERLRRSLGQR